MSDVFSVFILQVVPLVIAIVLHEISHGVAAYLLGDDTAKKAGRFKLYTHFDLFGSFLIPLGLYLLHSPFLIGYAKPVPVDPRNFKDPVTDMALVGIAGPLCNLLLAVVTAMCIRSDVNVVSFNADYAHYMVLQFAINFIVINLGLFFFNLIPIPPLDGSRIVAAFLPLKWLIKFYKIEPFGFIIIISIELLSRQISNLTGMQIGLFDSLIKTPLLATLKFLLS